MSTQSGRRSALRAGSPDRGRTVSRTVDLFPTRDGDYITVRLEISKYWVRH